MRGKRFILNSFEDEKKSFQIKENVTDLWH